MKTNLQLLIVSSIAALALAGCGKNSESKTTPTTPTTPPATNTAPGAVIPPANDAGGIKPGVAAPANPATTNNPNAPQQ